MYLVLALILQITMQANFTLYTFAQWKVKYNKIYSNSTQEIFREKVFNKTIQKLLNSSCECCGITKFSADTQEQINKRNNLLLPQNIEELANKQKDQKQKLKLSSSGNNQTSFLKLSSPSSLDWRDHGAVTPSKAQGTCGTCWSFATVGMCESSLILKNRAFNNKLYSVNLSQQYLLKCTPSSSCNGGYLQNSIDKALQKGLPYQSQFPYNPYSSNFNGVCSTNDLIEISNGTRVSKYNVDDNTIIDMLTDGPIAIAVSAVGWEGYNYGVYQCQPNSPINHAVLLIGYTPDYWIIKNSWGTDWGQDGIIYVTRNPTRNCRIGMAVHMLNQQYLNVIKIIILLVILLVY